MRLAALLIALALAAPASLTASTARSPMRTVPCGESIDVTTFPYVGSRDPKLRYRLVLGVVSVPPAYLTQIVPTGNTPWAYWRKQGLVVRAGRQAVTVSVPGRWRKRAAITWGSNTGIVSSLRIAGCGSDPSVGFAYAGGFYLRARSACVPLVFRVGARSATVRFGLGQRCR